MTHKHRAILIVALLCLISAVGVDTYLQARHEATARRKKLHALVETLDNLGFYRYAPADRVAGMKAEAVRTGYLFTEAALSRVVLADPEDLAEFTEAYIEEIAPYLKARGVQITSLAQSLPLDPEDPSKLTGDYTVTVNGRRSLIYTKDDGNLPRDTWTLAARRTFDLVNDLLERAGSRERVFLMYQDTNRRARYNDCYTVLLTPAMALTIGMSGLYETHLSPRKVAKVLRADGTIDDSSQ